MDGLDEWKDVDLQLLGLAVVVGFIQLLWAAWAARQQQGFHWAKGPRDDERPVTGMAARLERAFRNFMETFPLFAAALLLDALADKRGLLTLLGSSLYLLGRIAYVPLYAYGVAGWRSIVWAVSVLGLLLVTAALFMPPLQAAAA